MRQLRHFASEFSYCWACDMTICDGCGHTCVAAAEFQEAE